MPPNDPVILHASCVAWQGRGCLIIGASGSGKSSLALSLMACGATLVSDDRVTLTRSDTDLSASAPPAIRGLIEARGIGILTCEPADPVAIRIVVDMDRTETERLPENRMTELLGLRLPLLYRVEAPHFAPALIQLLKSGRQEP
jgi:HPr kinase/phosphorylase